ncbi:MAG: hypothetical protein QNJ65_12785 [Xenococcaceae cyanobacterium MO_234.B1]|nr:hypothetical protein [Xenococcaceae cyanobacterium MO_234.B1]
MGARLDPFDYLGIVYHGFAVIIPESPKSDRQRQRDFDQGLSPENF